MCTVVSDLLIRSRVPGHVERYDTVGPSLGLVMLHASYVQRNTLHVRDQCGIQSVTPNLEP